MAEKPHIQEALREIAEDAAVALEHAGLNQKAAVLRRMAEDPDISRQDMHSILRTYSELARDKALAQELDDYLSVVDGLWAQQ